MCSSDLADYDATAPDVPFIRHLGASLRWRGHVGETGSKGENSVTQIYNIPMARERQCRTSGSEALS